MANERKIFKTLEQQIEILRQKGLIIENEEYAKEVLFRENYFFLHGYRYPFLRSKNNRIYIEGTTFEELYNVFLFDRELRNVFFKNILIIENNTKSIFSYELSKKYGYKEKEYLNTNNFNNSVDKKRQVADLLTKMKRQIKNNAYNHAATMHYANKYGYIPLWISVKVLSFGIISELFTILKKEDQYDIVDIYGLEIDVYANYLKMLSNYRNLCAHEDIVYDNRTQKYIDDTTYHRQLKVPIMNNEYIYGKNDLFAIMIIFKELLQEEEFRALANEVNDLLKNLEYNLHTISIDKILDKMGFPKNWQELIDIKRQGGIQYGNEGK